MATSGIINGTLLRIYLDGTAIAYATECRLSFTREFREVLTKDSPGSGWAESYPGRKSGEMSTSVLYADTGDANTNVKPSALFDALDNGTPLILRYTTDVAGDTFYQVSGYCANWDNTSVVEDNVALDVSFRLHGAPTKGTES